MSIYRILNCPICSRHATEFFFSAAMILSNPKLKNKRKIFIGGFSKQYSFASQEFLVIRGNSWGFLWSGRHTRRWKGVGVCHIPCPFTIMSSSLI